MRKTLVIMIALILALSGCSTEDSAMLTEEETTQVESTEATVNVDTLLSTIHIESSSVSSPNSVGGVDLSVTFRNVSDKTIKYITFFAQPFNAVDDPVECRITGMSKNFFRGIGPIPPDDKNNQTYLWENAWYNKNVSYTKLLKISIEYMDGTSIDVPQEILEESDFPLIAHVPES